MNLTTKFRVFFLFHLLVIIILHIMWMCRVRHVLRHYAVRTRYSSALRVNVDLLIGRLCALSLSLNVVLIVARSVAVDAVDDCYRRAVFVCVQRASM